MKSSVHNIDHRDQSVMMEVDESSTTQWLTQVTKFMNAYKWLADSFVLDFYTENHWSTVPNVWKTYLTTLTPSDLAHLIDPEINSLPTPRGSIPPLSLTAFKSTIRTLSISRKHNEEIKQGAYLSSKLVKTREDGNISIPKTRYSGSKEFSNVFRKHVKLKKRHEVEQIGEIVSSLSSATRTTRVMDIGSGVGHLARYLTYEHGLALTCIDKEQQFGVSASKFDKELESTLSTLHNLPPAPIHKQADLQLSTSTRIELDCATTTSDEDKTKCVVVNACSHFYGITSLHSCGNLSPLALHSYVNSENAAYVVSLGCCYMKMDSNGFPLSSAAKRLGLHHSYEALEVSCHAIEQYCQKLRDGQVRKLLTHSYRATLECILTSTHGIRHAGLRSVPRTEDLTFQEYATLATSKLPITLNRETLESDEMIKSHLDDWFKVVLFYSLRLMIAQVIESSILLDRSSYIMESLNPENSRTFISPCFTPEKSPRNLGIISIKNKFVRF